MGLAEKRWAAERKKADEPAFKSLVFGTLGFDCAIEIDWDGFSEKLDDVQYIMHDSYGLPNLTKALATITADDIGKEAIKGVLKKIIVSPAKPDDTSFNFEDGVITWKAYFGGSSNGYIYADVMQAKLEKAL